MGHGNGKGNGIGISITIGNLPLFPPGQQKKQDRQMGNDNLPPPVNPRENASTFQNKQNLNSSASDLRNSLLAMVSDNNLASVSHGNSGNARQTAASSDASLPGANTQNRATNSPQNPVQIVNQTIDDLISTAQNHEKFTEFKSQPKEFWNQVKQMSEVQVTEKYVNGHFESRATSRYGEILEKFNRYGTQGFVFLNSLPENESRAFQARHLMNQQFGANELFIGRGVVIDQAGNFFVREMLANNGKEGGASLNTLLGILGGKYSENAASLFANGQLLLNPKTAALLSLSLTLYQNINTKLPLADAAIFAAPPNLAGKPNENGGARVLENNLESAKITAERRADNSPIVAALINGGLTARKEESELEKTRADRWKTGAQVFGTPFSAGATGAMFGAVLGCIVPLAEKNAGTALSFASSVVIGTSERGLKYLSSNLLISDVITSGVQNLLTAASASVFVEKEPLKETLNKQFNNYRTLAYLTS